MLTGTGRCQEPGTRRAISPECLTFSAASLFIFSYDSVLVYISWLFCQSLPLLFYTWVSASPKTGLPVSICLSVTS